MSHIKVDIFSLIEVAKAYTLASVGFGSEKKNYLDIIEFQNTPLTYSLWVRSGKITVWPRFSAKMALWVWIRDSNRMSCKDLDMFFQFFYRLLMHINETKSLNLSTFSTKKSLTLPGPAFFFGQSWTGGPPAPTILAPRYLKNWCTI